MPKNQREDAPEARSHRNAAADVAADADAGALARRVRACEACAERFAATASGHAPRPVLQIGPRARLLIASQAPGIRAHRSGRPFSDPSGVRLRAWLGLDEATFYDPSRVAILPMAFCFPGHDAKGGDLPPPAICAELWRDELLAAHPAIELVILAGRAAMAFHDPAARRLSLSVVVGAWEERLSAARRPLLFPIPHPSWRNNAWLGRNPWFEAEALPALRRRIAALLADPPDRSARRPRAGGRRES